jgi:hypothetical protein
MSRAKKVAGWILVAVLPVIGVVAAASPAQATTARLCLPVRLSGTGQDLGPDSQGNLHTSATLTAHGIRVGTTFATFTPSGPPIGAELAFSGPIVFTPRIGTGTLTAAVQGSVDLSTGTFEATSTRLTGTGLFKQTSGTLTFAGTENLSTGAFTETVTGSLCASGRVFPN